MTIFQAIVLGVVQGITEFLPISSSGHLIFLPNIFGWSDQGLSYDVVAHLGTLLAVVVYFRKRLIEVLLSFFHRGTNSMQTRRLGWLLILSVIPAGIVGFLAKDWIEMHVRLNTVVAVGLIFWGIILWIADRFSAKQTNTIDTHNISWQNAAFISFAQAIALIPGTSRSGITMTAGLFAKLDKKSAAEFSFLMSIPIILIAGVFKIVELVQEGFGDISAIVLFFGFIAAAISGFIAIFALMKIIQRWSFTPFAIYRIVVGLLILIYFV